jgi:hypothetical protein
MEKNNFMRKLYLAIITLLLLNLAFSRVEIIFETSFFKIDIGKNEINFKIKNLEEREKNLILDIFPSVYNEVSCSLNRYFLTLKPFEEVELKIFHILINLLLIKFSVRFLIKMEIWYMKFFFQ